MSDELVYQALGTMAQYGPFGDDYASNFMYNLSLGTSILATGTASVVKGTGAEEVIQDTGQKISEAVGHEPSEFNETYQEYAGLGSLIGTGQAGLMEGLTHYYNSPETFGNQSSMASIGGGLTGSLLVKGAEDGVKKAAEVLGD